MLTCQKVNLLMLIVIMALLALIGLTEFNVKCRQQSSLSRPATEGVFLILSCEAPLVNDFN